MNLFITTNITYPKKRESESERSQVLTAFLSSSLVLFCFVGLDFAFNCIKKFFQKIIKDVTTIMFIKSLSFEIVLCQRIGGC